MNNRKSKNIRSMLSSTLTLATPAVALLWCLVASPGLARAEEDGHDRRGPGLPSPACDGLRAPAGNRLAFHAYALGVQVYRWDGAKWAFAGPEAALFADPCYDEQVGIHYAGPTWESNDGSKVVGARLAPCTPNRGAIPWLLLGRSSSSGHGKFERVTYIQRVNTIGGTAPAEAGAFVGDEARVPYTAEYYFYRGTR